MKISLCKKIKEKPKRRPVELVKYLLMNEMY